MAQTNKIPMKLKARQFNNLGNFEIAQIMCKVNYKQLPNGIQVCHNWELVKIIQEELV